MTTLVHDEIVERFQTGDFIRHFKRKETNEGTNYLYIYIGTAKHTENKEQMAIYKALYGDGIMYARPLKMFNSIMDDGRCRFEKADKEDLDAIEKAFASAMDEER